ncbi:MAG: ABC transporter permease [Nitriliruptorales bacterium]|nr:ABC transporter permease [Nitriliruptorales bacterium]
MRRLVAGEFRKLFSTRLWLWLLLGSMALTALYASLNIAFADDPGNIAPPLSTPAGQRLHFAISAAGATTLVAVLAAIGLTGEFRHRTATPTFLATPRRGRVVLAKLVTYGLVGAGYAVACLAVTIAIGLPWLAHKGIDVSLIRNGMPATFVAIIAAVAIFALVGVGLGALLRDQVATVVGLLVYRFVAEPIVTSIPALESWTLYLPGPASSALSGITLSSREFLEPWLGGVVLAGYGVVLAVAGTFLAVRRDVT